MATLQDNDIRPEIEVENLVVRYGAVTVKLTGPTAVTAP